MIRIADLMRRMPELARAYALMADPDRHPTEQELAESREALARARAQRQSALDLIAKAEQD